MANSTATIKHTVTYTPPGGSGVSSLSVTIACPYQAQSTGTIDVADAAPADTEFTIPFGSIGTGASLLIVKNRTGQDMTLKVNGGSALGALPSGESVSFAGSSAFNDYLTSLSLTTTGIQDGAGYIDYWCFGDAT